MKLLSPLLIAAALCLGLGTFAACGSGGGGSTQRCGDGACSTDEDEESCPRDCPSACAPGQTRCDGNVLLICTSDGLHEVSQPCESGFYCASDGCVPVSQ